MIAYNLPVAIRLSGAINLAALEHSLATIIERHEILRTTFVTAEGRPQQIIGPVPQQSLSVLDLGQLPQSEREAHARQHILAEAQRPFDLAQGPLLRVTLWRLAEAEHIVLFVVHHIIGDGWSMGVLIQELMAAYTAFAAHDGNPAAAALPPLPIQYADFAQWQRQWLQGALLETQIDYWKQQLADLPVLQLPSDRPRPAVQTFRGATRSLAIPQPLVEQLKVLSQQQAATPFMLLLAAFKTLLHRYTGQTDIVVGTPVAGRTRRELEGLVGFFVNTLVLRTDLSGGIMFRELVAQGHAVQLVILVDSWLPPPNRAAVEPDDGALYAHFLRDIWGGLGKDIASVQNLPPNLGDEQLPAILAAAQEMQIIPSDISVEDVRALFGIFKRHLRALRRYAPQLYSGDLLLIQASDSAAEHLDAASLSWQALSSGRLSTYTIPGDHYTILQEPFVSLLANHISRHVGEPAE